MKKVIWTVLKLLGMAFVILSCIDFIHRMALVGSITGHYQLLVLIIFVDLGLTYWAYRVIWRPIKPRE